MRETRLRFVEEALLDIYGVTPTLLDVYHFSCRQDAIVAIAGQRRDAYAFEQHLCKVFHFNYKGIADSIASAERRRLPLKWRGRIRFDPDNPINERYEVEFLPPVVEDTSCLFSIDVGFDRMLMLEVQGVPCPNGSDLASQFANQFWAPMKLFQRGICFGGRTYGYLSGEISKSSKSKEGISTLMVQYFAENVADDGGATFSMPLTISDARNVLGRIDLLPPGKGNARVKLGFSPIFDGLVLSDAFIFVHEDVRGTGNALMTDGCGYISNLLARQLPYGIQQGIPDRPRSDSMPTPAIVQVRCACGRGLFKGCLLVTSDASLCPEGCVVFRPSMCKAEPSANRLRGEDCVLGVVNTFEHPDILQSSKERDMGEHSIRLNRSLTLLLHHLGVAEEFFTDLMRTEINSIHRVMTNRKNTYALVRQALFGGKSHQVVSAGDLSGDNEDVGEDSEDGGDVFSVVDDYYDDQAIERYQPATGRLSIAEQARDFLVSGHGMEDPYFAMLLRRLQLNKVRSLQRCNLQVRRSIYIVGAPDMYHLLQPDEVFVSLPIDHDQGQRKALKLNHGYVVGPVVVSRHPMYHPGDVRRFTAVFHPQLAEHLETTSGGVVLFSTRGDRAPADMMSGGDYDGDQFVVIYSSDPQLIDLRAVTPCAAEETTAMAGGPTASPPLIHSACVHARGGSRLPAMCGLCGLGELSQPATRLAKSVRRTLQQRVVSLG